MHKTCCSKELYNFDALFNLLLITSCSWFLRHHIYMKGNSTHECVNHCLKKIALLLELKNHERAH